MIGDKIGDREISLVPNRGDDWNRRLAYRARDFLSIERPQVFSRSTAAADDQNVDEICRASFAQRSLVVKIDQPDGVRDLWASHIALNARRRKQNVHGSRAT